MATNTIYTKILLRNDTTANWTANSTVVLAQGEVGLEKLTTLTSGDPQLNKFKLKVGDGTTNWQNLPYLTVDSTEIFDYREGSKKSLSTVIGELLAAVGKIEVNGILKGDGTGEVTAAVADHTTGGTDDGDYRTPAKSKIELNQTPTGYTAQVPVVITLGENKVTPATLGTDGKVPATQLPSYVDDVIEGYYYNTKFYKEASHTTEIAGEPGKIYVDITDGSNKTYRWSSGAGFIEISTQAVYDDDGNTTSLSNDKKFSVVKTPGTLNVGTKTFNGSTNVTINDSDVPTSAQVLDSNNVHAALVEAESEIDDLYSTKITKVASATAGNIATLTSDGSVQDSSVAISDVVTKVASATSGNLASLDNNGKIQDSGVASTSVVTSVTKNGSSTGVSQSNHVVDIEVPVSGTGNNAVTVDSDDQEMHVDNVTTDILKNGSNVFIINGGNAASSGEAPSNS